MNFNQKPLWIAFVALCAGLLSAPAIAQQTQQPLQNQGGNFYDQFNYGFGQQPQQQQAEPPKAFNPYDKKYRPKPRVAARNTGVLVGDRDFVPTIVRLQGAGVNDMILRMTAGKAVSGCLKKGDQAVSIEKADGIIKVKLSGGEVTADTKTVRYAHYQCDIKSGIVTADIPLNREELINDQIKWIHIQTENISTLAKLKVEILPDRIKFTEDAGLGKPAKKTNLAGQAYDRTFWLYPERTIVLYTNATDKSEEMMSMLRTFARSKGMTPIEEVLPAFTDPAPGSGKIYVVDDKGLYDKESPSLGEIEIPEKFFGPKGEYERLVKKQVYGQELGLYD